MIETDKTLSQYFTPSILADWMADLALSRGRGRIGSYPYRKILEPSAGDGALARSIHFEMDKEAHLTCIEVDARLIPTLESIGGGERITVKHRDFLAVPVEKDSFDIVIMNPPYENGQDLDHVVRALEWAPRVVALVRSTFLCGVKRRARLWSRGDITIFCLAILSKRPKFTGGGNGSPRHDFIVVDIMRGELASYVRTRVEWWGIDWNV